jgi:hypothetical protein
MGRDQRQNVRPARGCTAQPSVVAVAREDEEVRVLGGADDLALDSSSARHDLGGSCEL